MTKKIASLYAELSLNERLFQQGIITKDMYMEVNAAIIVEIDKAQKSLYNVNDALRDGGLNDGIIHSKTATG